MELAAWIAGPWAVSDLTGNGWMAVPAALVLVALPSLFSTEGDKHQVIVATPGPIRLGIELIFIAVAVSGAWVAWPGWLATVVSAAAVAALVTGTRRASWLLAGAPPVG